MFIQIVKTCKDCGIVFAAFPGERCQPCDLLFSKKCLEKFIIPLDRECGAV